jgi:SAM-dependent methyltransferase
MEMGSRDHWHDVYAAKSPDEVSWFEASPSSSLKAIDRLGPDRARSIVDVGGGASSLADALLDRGWRDITVLDIADTALAASQERLGPRAAAVNWLVADIRVWSPGRTFEIWHDRAVFHFLTDPGDRAGYKSALEAGTKSGSQVIIATFAVDGPEKCSGLPVQRYDAKSLAAELGPGFHSVEDWHETHMTPWGAPQAFQWALFVRT